MFSPRRAYGKKIRSSFTMVNDHLLWSMILDDHLLWSMQMNHAETKLNQVIGIFS